MFPPDGPVPWPENHLQRLQIVERLIAESANGMTRSALAVHFTEVAPGSLEVTLAHLIGLGLIRRYGARYVWIGK